MFAIRTMSNSFNLSMGRGSLNRVAHEVDVVEVEKEEKELKEPSLTLVKKDKECLPPKP
jgi:hypothetical protein